MKLFCLVAVLGAVASSAFAYDNYRGYSVYRLHPQNAQQLDYLQKLEDSGVDFWRSPDKENRVADMMLKPGEERERILKELESVGIKSEIFIRDVELFVYLFLFFLEFLF